jgi:hypothetical protein
MNVGIRNEAVQFNFWKYLFPIVGTLRIWNLNFDDPR